LKSKVLIVGGGASGILAALSAAELGANVTLLEAGDRIGKKILATGNGRCNITNENICIKYYHGEDLAFIEYVLNSFSLKETLDFFYSLGLPIKTLEEGKMFPRSLQASSVLDILRFSLEEKGVEVITNARVEEINYKKSVFNLKCKEDKYFQGNKVIIATGGKAFPSSGSDGSGYPLAEHFNHKIIHPLPALVQLKLSYDNLKALSGVKFVGRVKILVDEAVIREEAGEILFTDYGISGPPILQLSRIASESLYRGKNVKLQVCIISDMTQTELRGFMEERLELFADRSIQDSLIGVINKKLIPILLKEIGIKDIHHQTSSIPFKTKANILKLLNSWEFIVKDTNSFINSQVTAGGIATIDINKETLESKLQKGLYFCGEIVDVDGDCGGYNLQWAWSSGRLAGKSAAISALREI
jgi:predicted Rossmann fold flavoprotein